MPDYYGTLAAADAYFAARENTAWAAGSEADKQAALIRASGYIDGMVGLPVPATKSCVYVLPGKKAGGYEQLLQWPRTDAVDRLGEKIPGGVIPVAVEYATYQAAVRELASPGSLNPDFVASQIVQREKVGPLETEYAVSKNGSPSNRPVIGDIDALLYPYLVVRCHGIGVRTV